jgi:hypothetical protein
VDNLPVYFWINFMALIWQVFQEKLLLKTFRRLTFSAVLISYMALCHKVKYSIAKALRISQANSTVIDRAEAK